jgi:hypothetical protein
MITNTALTTTPANVYVSSGNSVLSTIHFCNYSGSPVNIHVYAVPSGSSASNSNMIYSNVTIQGGDTYIVYQEKFILGNNQSIQANASANSAITTTVSYTGV